MKVYGYIRVSSKGQVDGDGPQRQKLAIETFCHNHSLEQVGFFSDDGVSGTVEAVDRPQFSEMLQYIKTHSIDGFVVERMDRLARDLMVSEIILKTCREEGIKVYCVDQGELINMAEESEDPTRTLIRQVIAALAQWEKTALVKKLKSARERVKAETGRCEGNKPYGRTLKERKILDVMNWIIGEQQSPGAYGKVAKLLNDSGLTSRLETKWTRQMVRSVWLNYKKETK